MIKGVQDTIRNEFIRVFTLLKDSIISVMGNISMTFGTVLVMRKETLIGISLLGFLAYF